ncbi:MAG: hypothetical protein Q4F18_15200 [Clostridia bacterium]|nr:hypothetical protein [Clostridia bacterium]
MMEIDYETLERLRTARTSLRTDIEELHKSAKRDPALDGLIDVFEAAMGAVQVDLDRYEEMADEAWLNDEDDPSDPEYGYDIREAASWS